jgi:type II secretory pathway pseudopilin PulG
MNHHRKTCAAGGFTTVELLVAIGIIILLIGILVPLVGRLQTSAKTADTRSFISQLSGAIERYHGDFKAYPGPISNDEVYHNLYGSASFPSGAFGPNGPFNRGFQMATGVTGFADASGDAVDGKQRITMAENLVLGLLGGLKLEVANAGLGTPDVTLVYDPSLVGRGPISLNTSNTKPYNAYLEAKNLSWRDVQQGTDRVRTGAFLDEASGPDGANDSIIPEFVDQFTDPMPILYLRAKRGATSNANTTVNNAVITYDPGGTQPRRGPYDLSQVIAYTDSAKPIGVGKKLPQYYADGAPTTPNPPGHHGLRTVEPQRVLGPPNNPNYYYPYDAFPYFRDPTLSGSQDTSNLGRQLPRQKDAYILISAGPDRLYGTTDDITNFGSVSP